MINISVIGTAGIPANYGGFETLVENLVKFQSDKIKYTVFCSSRNYTKRMCYYKNAKLKYINLNANGGLSIIYDLVCMLKSLRSDVMIILGVSGAMFIPLIKVIYKGKIITNIDGLEWKRGKWNKNIKSFLKFSEKNAVIYSDVVIGDNKIIIEYVFNEYNKNAKLIEYGADHIELSENNISEFNFIPKNYAITVCRIEPENNIKSILEAFSLISEIPLVIVGNWNNSIYGKDLYEKFSGYKHINLLDPIYDPNKINYLRSNARYYIHGHSAGGTNPSLVEAMYIGLPIFAFDCEYNKETTEFSCFYWNKSKDLLSQLQSISDSELSLVGSRMKNIAQRRYLWEIITNKYENLFLEEI